MRLLFLVSYCFFLFYSWTGNAQVTQETELNNSVQAQQPKEQIKTYFNLATSYIGVNDSLSIVYANQMLELSRLLNDSLNMGKAFYLLGDASKSKSLTNALEFYKSSSAIFTSHNSHELKDVYFELSNIYTTFSEFPEALNYGLKSLEYNQKSNNQNEMQRDMSYIGYIHDRMYEFEESISWNRKALEIALQLEDKNAQAVCYGRIGIAYDELAENDNFNEKLFDSALYYNLKAAKLSEETGDLGFARTTYSNIGNSYSKLKRYDKAEEYTLKSLKVPGFEERKGVTLVNLGKIYLETGRYTEAEKILDSAMRNTIYFGTRKYQLEAYYRFHELDVKKGNYKSALSNYISYKSIEDSLLNETKTRQIVEMSERFKSAEKEIQLAKSRATLAEKDLSIQRKNIQMFGLGISALILSILGYLFINQQKLKNRQLQKENALNDALAKIETQSKLQDQRLRISRDLHDNIGAQLTFIISSLDNLKYGFKLPIKLDDKLKGISAFTSSTIYELRDTIWAMNKNEITFDDLHSRISNFIEKADIAAMNTSFKFVIEKNLSSKRSFTSIEGVNIYRIIQESINNAIKYAEAKDIKVHISENTTHISIAVNDNGLGFNSEAIEFGNGIYNMKKRAMEINADLILESIPGKGTSVILLMPINT